MRASMAIWPKSRQDRVVSGTLGGLAEKWGIHPTGLRIGYAIATFLTGILPGVVVYVILALIMD